MTITPGINMINGQMTPFSYLLFELYPLVYFIFAFQYLQDSVPWDPPLRYLMDCKIQIYMPKMSFSDVLT